MRNDILITGKGGFIGSRIHAGQAFKGDANYSNIFKQSAGKKGIVHLAAISNRKSCEEDPRETIRINLLFLADVLMVALKKNIWVLFVSTYQVREPSLYGMTKLLGEELCRIYQSYGLKVKILRLPIVYGPGDRPYKVVTKIINEIKAGQIPVIKTRKKFYFAYVDDVARMIESKVDVINGGIGKRYSLRNLEDGIRRCLNEKKK